MKVDYKLLKKSAQKYTLLYVEDEAALREITSEYFTGLFQEVVIAKDGEEAFLFYNEYFKMNGKYFDIVITDIQMPNMNGITLSRKLITHNKEQKVLIVSAYNETKYFIELIKIGVAGFMQKPLTSVQILDILLEVCLELDASEEHANYIQLPENFRWNKKCSILEKNKEHVLLTKNETHLLGFLVAHVGHILSDLDIFNLIYNDDIEKDFSSDAIKSLIKRLRKKLPSAILLTHKNLGYSLQINI
ncbi:response regulator transcription factor [Sulfurimonas sp. SAG-AH-194-I05]|nr:response regulator [Sulfurimonas sp. SAG-AH-194-I05]MDF1875357.1 response regulator transcription factor [Sulfurimonas sp. SAG-AH-194-I05]